MSFFRMFFMLLDKVVFGLVDDAYNLIFYLSGVFINSDIAKSVIKNLYVVVGIFAFFKIAILLVNSIIDPEKLSSKGKGLSSILSRTVIMLVILVFTPTIFEMGYVLQEKVMGWEVDNDSVKATGNLTKDGNLIEKLILGESVSTDNDDTVTPGEQFRTIALSTMITVNNYYTDGFRSIAQAEKDNQALVGYHSNGKCSSQTCEAAISKWNEMYANGKMDIDTLSDYITVNEKDTNGTDQYVYNYSVGLNTFAGGFIVYMLFSFSIDIAIRVFQLAVLEIVSPLFIVDFINPNGGSSGMFGRWLKEVGSTYASLFIKIACISLMILFVSILNKIPLTIESSNTLNGWVKLTLMFGLLIFAKKAPKYISDLIGIKSDGNGLSIGKKLASAALVGGAIGKGLDAAKGVPKKIGNKAKERAKRNLGNTSDRALGKLAARNLARRNIKNGKRLNAEGQWVGKDETGALSKKQTMARMIKAKNAALKAQQAADPNNDNRLFKNTRDKYDAMVQSMDGTYQSSREKKLGKLNAKADAKLALAGITASDVNTSAKLAKDVAAATAMYGAGHSFLNGNGGFNKSKYPISASQQANATAGMLTVESNGQVINRNAFTSDEIALTNWANSVNGRSLITDESGLLTQIKTEDGNIYNVNSNEAKAIINSSRAQTTYGRLNEEQWAYEHQISYQNDYASNVESRSKAVSELSNLTANLNSFLSSKISPENMKNISSAKTPEERQNIILSLLSDSDKESYKTFSSSVERMQDTIRALNTEIEATEKYYKASAKSNPKDDDSVVEANGRFINKIGEYIKLSDGSYEFQVKDMSREFDLITSEQDNKLEKRYKKNVEDAKPQELKKEEKE